MDIAYKTYAICRDSRGSVFFKFHAMWLLQRHASCAS